ncbi:MAG: signal peptidase I [Spirochaetaceae bacterium]|nr:signal peptidase I [Spirochaetaceae bacterium]
MALSAVLLILKTFVVDIFVVEGKSMEGSISEKSVVFENKLAYGLVNPFKMCYIVKWAEPRVGDVVFFPLDGKMILKRCVATEGTPLFYQNSNGYFLYVNDDKIPLSESQYQRIKSSPEVPKGMILAIGDNYDESIDSRNYGFVDTEYILGKAFNE